MKAAQITKYGGSEVVKINNNAPKPVASKGKILEVYAAGINLWTGKSGKGICRR